MHLPQHLLKAQVSMGDRRAWCGLCPVITLSAPSPCRVSGGLVFSPNKQESTSPIIARSQPWPSKTLC